MRVTLRVLEGPHVGRTFNFDRHDTFMIGRAEDAQLCLPDDRFFSRHHCLLEIAPPRCFLRDLGSTNGTFVNGTKVTEAYLRDGDKVQGGKTVLTVEVTADQGGSDMPTTMPLEPVRPSVVMVRCLNCGRTDQAEASRPDEQLSYLCEDCREELRRRPQPVPGYDTIKILGRGGMGCVILARHSRTGNLVAVKTLLPEVAVSEQSMRRFMREIDVAAALQHPHIVRFIDRGVNNGVVYLVTEYVDGADAAKVAASRGGRLPPSEAVQILSQALDALGYAHSKGFIHRDIKDPNILIGGSWPNQTAKLTDFGLAKSFTQTGMSGVTMAGDVAGTITYMPPEQVRDFGNLRPSSDIYAIGMTGYSLLSGKIALDISPQAGVAEIVKAIFERPIVPLTRRVPEISPEIAEVIERALAKDPQDRWASADAMRNALLSAR